MQVDLSGEFEADVREAALEELEAQLVGEFNPLAFQAIDRAHDRLREFEDQYPGVDSIIESLQVPEVERTANGLRVTFGWSHPAAPYFELGTSDHTIDGQPVLSFVWESPPEWVREEFDPEGDGYRVFFDSVEVEGLDETRFMRSALNWLRAELEDV
jgi:hypothetical protein